MRILILDKWIGTNFDITTSSCNTVSSVLSWLLVVYIPCHFISDQLLFALHAGRYPLKKDLVHITRAMSEYYEISILIFFMSDSTLSQAKEIMLLCCAWNCRFTPINPHKK